jgi:DHA1 family bicyclomycin/chloramphenicol resistance-like MFS transporter
MIVSASPIIAPVIGSLIFTYFGWQANFIVMAIIALILVLQSQKGLCESPFWSKPQEAFLLKNVIKAYKEILPIPTLWFGSFIMMFSFAAVMLSVINSSYLIIDQLGFSPLGFGIIFIFNGLNIIVGNYIGIGLRKYLSMGTTIYLGCGFIAAGGVAMLAYNLYYEFSLMALSFALISNLGISVCAPPTMSLTLSNFKENTGIALAFMNTVRMFGSSLLAMLMAHLLMRNLNALPVGLILIGLATGYCAWRFNNITSETIEEMDTAQTA